jgi:predicted nucleotidyltransferase
MTAASLTSTSGSTIPLPAGIEGFCTKWSVHRLELFGSVLRDDFRSDSDVDVLVSFETPVHPTVYQMIDMQDELETIFGRKVDLITRRSVERSRDQISRKKILESARVIYEK